MFIETDFYTLIKQSVHCANCDVVFPITLTELLFIAINCNFIANILENNFRIYAWVWSTMQTCKHH